MASPTATCPSCSKKYAGFGGDDARKPVVFTCLCVFCKGCALQEEANAQQQQPAAVSSGGKKGKKKEKKGRKEKAINGKEKKENKRGTTTVNEPEPLTLQ